MARPRILHEMIVLINALRIAISMAFIKDPCKKCLVRVCCNRKCKEKEYQIEVMSPFDFKEGKVLAWIILTSSFLGILPIFCISIYVILAIFQ